MKPTDTSFPVIEENKDLLSLLSFIICTYTESQETHLIVAENGGENNISEGMYENRVKNDVKIFKIPALF